jgi:hypothetical protein
MKIKKIFSSETTWPFGIKVCKYAVKLSQSETKIGHGSYAFARS